MYSPAIANVLCAADKVSPACVAWPRRGAARAGGQGQLALALEDVPRLALP